MNEEEYIKNRLDNQIDWYDRKSMKNQKSYKRLQLTAFFAAAAIPFLSGYISADIKLIQIIIGLLGFIIAVITAVLSIYKFQENWIEYRTTCESLRHEKYLFLTKASPYDSGNPFTLFVQRIESLISKENSDWSQYIKLKKNDRE